MEKIKMQEEDLRKIIKETIDEEELQTYYVANSSYFDTHSYDTNKISKAVQQAGGRNIRTENAYDWSNQPEVVVFDADEKMVEDVAAEVSKELDTEWVHIKEKDW